MDSDRFYIARMLGKTIKELGDMELAEYHQWRAFLSYEAAMRKLNSGA